MLAPLTLANEEPTRLREFEARLAHLEPIFAELEHEFVSGDTIADDAADALEEAAFLAGVMEATQAAKSLPAALLELAALAAERSSAYRHFLGLAPAMHRGAPRDAIETFLATGDVIARTEHATDAKEREVTFALLAADPPDARMMVLAGGIAHHLEAAVDALLHASLVLRDHVLGNILFA